MRPGEGKHCSSGSFGDLAPPPSPTHHISFRVARPLSVLPHRGLCSQPAVSVWGDLSLGICVAHFSFLSGSCPAAPCSSAVITGPLACFSPLEWKLHGGRPWLCSHGDFWASRTEPGTEQLLAVHQLNNFSREVSLLALEGELVTCLCRVGRELWGA